MHETDSDEVATSADTGAQAVHVHAPAKLTLSLRMTGLRDDGMHLIDAEMIALDFGDELTITPTDEHIAVTVDGVGDGVPLGPDNLVAGALRLAARTARVHIDKKIPPGAGLGGGSANAAAVLRWAGFDDLTAASALGADISFCMVGGRARVQGIGERVTPLPFEPMTLTLLTPPFGCNTAEVYRAWDALGGPVGEHGNDLETAALQVAPELVRWREMLAEDTGQVPRLAGSGSTWFVEGAYPGDGRVVCSALDHF